MVPLTQHHELLREHLLFQFKLFWIQMTSWWDACVEAIKKLEVFDLEGYYDLKEVRFYGYS
jgi:hypothetical protein